MDLKHVVYDRSDEFQLNADYFPTVAARFESELLPHSVDAIIQAEAVEEDYREEEAELTNALFGRQEDMVSQLEAKLGIQTLQKTPPEK